MSGRPDPGSFRLSPASREVVDGLEDAGFQAWAVGGVLRDIVARRALGPAYARPGGDEEWDFATDARPEDIVRIFRRTVPVGIEHGTVRVLVGDHAIEVTTFRRDVETDGRHATVTFADRIEDDLDRRDFTINAMAWRPRDDDWRDPHGGAEDLEAGLLRAVGVPADRFREDYLRVLRGLRFAGRFDLEIEAETDTALREAASGLGRLSAERIREELMKVVRDRVPSTALELYAEYGALEPWYRELADAPRDRERWQPSLARIDELPPARAPLRVAAWLTLLEGEGPDRAAAADALLTRLKFSNADRRAIRERVERYLPFVGPLDSSAQRRRWLSEVGDAWRDLFRLHGAGARVTGSAQAVGYVVAAWRGVHDEVLEHPPLRLGDLAIDGGDVLELGVTHGPIVGLLLEELLEQVLEDPERNTRETLLEEASRLIELGALDGPRPAEPS